LHRTYKLERVTHTSSDSRWPTGAIRRIEADNQRSAGTHLIPWPLPHFAAQAEARVQAALAG